MPRKPRDRFVLEFGIWNLFTRDGVFYADGRGNTPNLGKHSLETRDRDQAVKNLRELDRSLAVDRGITVPTENDLQGEISIQDGWLRYMAFVQRPDVAYGAEAAAKRYRPVRDKHIAWCQTMKIRTWNEIDKKSVLEYAKHLKNQNQSDNTAYLECTLLKSIVKWMIEEEKILPESNRVHLKLRRPTQSNTYCPSVEEVFRILEYCRTARNLGWLGYVLRALATTGMRIGELARLRWSNISMAQDMITVLENRSGKQAANELAVQTTKNRKTRLIPIHPALKAILTGLQRRSDGRVFGGPRNGLLKPDTVRNILIKDILEPLKKEFPTPSGERGFLDIRPHGFRHFFVSQAFLGGASEGEIRSWVGHADSRIVERYRHLRNDDSKRKMNNIRFFGDDTPTGMNAG